MWIVRLALRRPYTMVVLAVVIAILGVFTILRMPTDILPEIDIPVISVMWSYQGMSPREMEGRIVSNYERALTTLVNDIEHIESQTLAGISVTKIFFHPRVHIDAAIAEVSALSQTVLRSMPPGIGAPLIIRYSATNVPILQASLGSDTLTEAQLFDLAANFVRGGLATVQGAQIPWPYGGKSRQVMVDIDPAKLHAYGLSPADVSDALAAQNLILPGGVARIGDREVTVRVASSPELVEAFGDLPVKSVGDSTIFLRDIGHVRDGFVPQQSIVRVDRRKGTLLSVLKSPGASTLDIVRRVRDTLPDVLATLPRELKVTLLFDQSVFVRAAVEDVLKEAGVAAALTALMILLFLGSWRSTLVVVTSIPLSILVSILILGALGQTLNLMTLGGMALAVGILVDDATVEVENIHRNLGQRKRLVKAILDGAMQIATPAFVSTLAICIVFVPIFFMTGVARSLFSPLAMAVVFAMLASYFLSRTLVPTMVQYLLRSEVDRYGGMPEPGGPQRRLRRPGPGARFHEAFLRGFARLRHGYGVLLAWALAHRAIVLGGFVLFAGGTAVLVPMLGRDFFPQVDAGLLRMHVRAPAGTRLEQSDRIFATVEEIIRKEIPSAEIDVVLSNFGIPVSAINLALGDPSMISSADGEITVSLRKPHGPTRDYARRLRTRLHRELPQLTVFFLPADISTQVLNFGLSAPIDVQVIGPPGNFAANLRVAEGLRLAIGKVRGAVDVHLHQVVGAPELRLDVDRALASQVGLSQRDVASSLLVSLSSSSQTQPTFWLDPVRGVQYFVAAQTPIHRIDSVDALERTPVAVKGTEPQLLANLTSRIQRGTAPVNVTHHNVLPTFDVLANVDGRDLGAVVGEVEKIVSEARPTLPRGTRIVLRGQAESMVTSFTSLAWGLLFASVLVYLLMVVNFQSWADPLIILSALPGALCGVVWILFATRTTVSVPALMGVIMTVGVATANSILLVSFAREQRAAGKDAISAALAAGLVRLRPVLMTALAMLAGMLPMSLALGEGGEQNAPLGRAVIGGLAVATVTTLFVVPVIFSLVRRREVHVGATPEELR
jgi:multidrug efflux pump subunit AcrB